MNKNNKVIPKNIFNDANNININNVISRNNLDNGKNICKI